MFSVFCTVHAVSRRVPIILVPFTGHAETNHDNTNGDTMAMEDDGSETPRTETPASDTMTIPERRHDNAKHIGNGDLVVMIPTSWYLRHVVMSWISNA